MNQSLKERLSRHLYDRLCNRYDSLRKFEEKWKGTASGIEGWLKVEFVAATAEIENLHVKTGGSGGRGRRGRFPDLILKYGDQPEICVELKGSTNWFTLNEEKMKRYKGWLLVVLCGQKRKSSTEEEKQISICQEQPIPNTTLCLRICDITESK